MTNDERNAIIDECARIAEEAASRCRDMAEQYRNTLGGPPPGSHDREEWVPYLSPYSETCDHYKRAMLLWEERELVALQILDGINNLKRRAEEEK